MALLTRVRMFTVLVISCFLFRSATAIYEGREFSRGHAKFSAFIDVTSYGTYCSAVIVSPKHTMTAALCQANPLPVLLAVAYAGNNRYTEPNDFASPVQRRVVEEWISYDPDQQTLFDVSLQRLDSPWQFNSFVAAIPLTSDPTLPTDLLEWCEVTGFGYGSLAGADSGVGRVAPQRVSSWRACLAGGEEQLLCAGGGRVCAGDVGAPVACADQLGRRRLYGIAITSALPTLDRRCSPQASNPSFAFVGFYYQWVLNLTGGAVATVEDYVEPRVQTMRLAGDDKTPSTMDKVAVVARLIADILADVKRSTGVDPVVMGVFVFLVAVLTVWGVCNRNAFITYTNLVTLSLLAVAFLSVGVMVLTMNRDVISESQFYGQHSARLTAVDDIQLKDKCCGFGGPEDYQTLILPSTCCERSRPCLQSSRDLRRVGCQRRLADRQLAARALGCVSAGVGVFLAATSVVISIFLRAAVGSGRCGHQKGGKKQQETGRDLPFRRI